MTRTPTAAVMTALASTILISACESVTEPPTLPAVQSTSGTLSGVVFEITAGTLVGIEGVEVYCDTCGPVGHSHRFTEAAGGYDFGEVANGNPLLVVGSKQGYNLARPEELVTGWMGSIRATVRGASRFNIELVRQ